MKSRLGLVRSSMSLLRSRYTFSQHVSFFRYHSILGNLFPTCNKCGIKLQKVDPQQPGYYFLNDVKSPTAKVTKSSDRAFESIYENLSAEDRALLLNTAPSETPSQAPSQASEQPATAPSLHQDHTHTPSISCIRCRDAIYRENFNLTQHPVESVDSVLSGIDPLGNIVHLVNAYDFPLTLHPSIFRFKDTADIRVIVTKGDLLFSHSKTANNYGIKFFRDYLNRKYGILPENVFLSSGKVDWNIKELVERLPDNSYFVGEVNVGKSTLVKSLLYGDVKFGKSRKQALLSKRDKVKLEKEEDYLINNPESVAAAAAAKKTTFKAKRQERNEEERFKAKNGPGVSFMPAFTRGNMKFELENFEKTLFDVPGIGQEDHGLYQWIDEPKLIKQLTKGTRVSDTGSYDSRYFTVKGGQCLTVGGLFYLQVPSHSMVQIRNSINFKDHLVFRDFPKARESVQDKFGNEAITKKIVVTPESASNLVKYVVPPFHGAIDLVIKGMGHINIKPVGKFNETEIFTDPFVVYLPRGCEAIIRRPIMKYISKTIVGRDKKGNVLDKKHWVSKGIKEIHPYTGEVFSSKLIPVSDETPNLREYVKTYCEHMNGREIEEDGEIDKLPQKYWIEL